MYQAGIYDRWVRLEKNVETRDPLYNTAEANWIPFFEGFAQVQDIRPSRAEAMVAATAINMANRPAKIQMPYVEGVTSDMRIILLDENDRMLHLVTGAAMLGRREAIEFVAEEYSSSGDIP